MKHLFASFFNYSTKYVFFAKEDVLKPDEPEMQIDDSFNQKIRNVLQFMTPESLKGNTDDIAGKILNNLPGKVEKKTQAEEIKKAIASSEAFAEAFLGDVIEKSQDFLRNEDHIGFFAQNQSLFDTNLSREPYAAFQENIRSALSQKMKRDPFTDEEWNILSNKLSEEFERFYKKSETAYLKYSIDKKGIAKEIKIFEKLIHTEKSGEILWKKSFDSAESMFEWWKKQPEIQNQLKQNKGKRKEQIEAELKILVEKEFPVQQSKYLEYAHDYASLEKAKNEIKVLTDQKKVKKEFWQKKLNSPKDLMTAWLETSPALAKKINSAKGQRKIVLESFLKNLMEEQFFGNNEKQNIQLDKKIQKSQEIFKGAEKKYRGNEYQKISSDEIEELVRAELKSEKLFESLPQNSEERQKLGNHIDSFWAQTKKNIEDQKEIFALNLIENLDVKGINFKDQNNENFSFFMKNFSENVFFDNATWEKVSKSAYKKFKELHKQYLNHLEKNTDLIPRTEMAQKWKKFLGKMKNYSLNFSSLDDFQAQFAGEFFKEKSQELKTYFLAHPNFKKSFQKSFEVYQIKQKEYLDSKFESLVRVVSDESIRSGMKASFGKAKNSAQRQKWIDYAQEKAPLYEFSIRKNHQQERIFAKRFASLKGNPEAEKILGNFEQYKKNYEQNKSVYETGKFVSPRTYADQLNRVDLVLGGIEVNEKIQVELAKKTIQKIDFLDLDSAQKYKNYTDFKRQPFLESTISFSDSVWEKVKFPVFELKMAELWKQQLEIQNKDEKIPGTPETEKVMNFIQSLSLSDVDSETEWSDFFEFKKQPKIQSKISSYPKDIWKSVNASFFQPKMVKLWTEYLKSKEKNESENWKKDIENMSLGDISDIDDPRFLEKGVLAKEFKIQMDEEVWKKEGKPAFSIRLDQIHKELSAYQKSSENSENVSLTEFGKKDIQKIASSHGLNFSTLILKNRKNLQQKFEKLDVLLSQSSSFKRLIQGNEFNIVPFFLNVLGEMNSSDFEKTISNIGTGYKDFDQISESFFGNDRMKYLSTKVRKENHESWNKLVQGEKRMKNSKISKILFDENETEKELPVLEEIVISKTLKENDIKPQIKIKPFPLDKKDENVKEIPNKDLEEDDSQEFFDPEENEFDAAQEINQEKEFFSSERKAVSLEEAETISSEEEIERSKNEIVESKTQETEEADETQEAEEKEEILENKQEKQKIPEIFTEEEADLQEEPVFTKKAHLEEEVEESLLSVQEDEQKDPFVFAEKYMENGMKLLDILNRVENYLFLVLGKDISVQKNIDSNILIARVPKSQEFFIKIVDFLFENHVGESRALSFSKEGEYIICVIEKEFGIVRKAFSVNFEL